MSLTISAARLIAAGETLGFNDNQAGLILQGSGYALTIEGALDVSDAPASLTGGVTVGINYNTSANAPTITVGVDGVISVHVSQSLRTAIGVQGSTTGDFTNRGLLEVSSQTGQAAAGAFGGNGFDFVNSGMIRVTAGTEARGVFMTGVSFTNSGTIDIHGHGFEYGVSGSDATGAFVNTGTIRVDNTGPGFDTVGAIWGGASFSNSGTIAGFYALQGGPASALNTGTLDGQVMLDGRNTNFTNNGVVTGQVALGGGNDTYSGTGRVGSLGVRGGDGADVLNGSTGNDYLVGDAGSDTIEGNGGADQLDGGAGFDLLSFAHSSAGVTAGILGSNAFNFEGVVGSAFSDSLAGAGGSDSLSGGAGGDTMDSGGGDDTVAGGAGADQIFTGSGADQILVGAGESGATAGATDVIGDWSSSDMLVFAGGGVGGATYTESTAADYASALAFANSAIGGGAANFVAVAVGANTYVFADSANNNGVADDAVLLLGRGLADIDGANLPASAAPVSPPPPPPSTSAPPAPSPSLPTSSTTTVSGNMDIVNLDVVGEVTEATPTTLRFAGQGLVFVGTGVGFTYSGDSLTGGSLRNFNLTVANPAFALNIALDPNAARSPATLADDSAASVFSTLLSANDIITGGPGFDLIRGYAGNDQISGNGGANTIFGGTGDDVIYAYVRTGVGASGQGTSYLRGEEGNDYLVGGDLFDDLHGNTGNDTVQGGAFDDWVVGGQGNDLLFGDDGGDLCYGQLGSDTVNGGAGNDAVVGGQANDILNGGDGDDFVTGDRGDDTVTGGLGADTFHTNNVAGIDRVTDFNAAEGDKVLVDAGSAYNLFQVGADVVVDMSGGNQLVLAGVQLSSLPNGWIVGG